MTSYGEHLRACSYHDYFWFHDMMKLMSDTTLGWFRCAHEGLPRSKRDWLDVDPYFIEEMKLEAKGWKTISVGQYSDYELSQIAEAIGRFPKEARLSQITPSEDIFPIIGIADNPSFTVTVRPELVDHFESFMQRFSRHHAIVTRATISEDLLSILPENHRVIEGSDATLISYDHVEPDIQAVLVALHDNSLRRPNKFK